MAKILIIDDDKLIRWSLSQVFSQEDYSVDSVATAEAAVEHVMKNSYHLIITDLEIDANNSFQMLSKEDPCLPALSEDRHYFRPT